MTYLTTAEVADVKGCSPQYARRLCQHGKLNCIITDEAANNRTEYRVPLDALSDKERIIYENRKRKELGLGALPVPSISEPKPDPKQITLQDLNGGQRRDAALWCRIIQEWLEARGEKSAELGGKCKFDELYCAAIKLQYPDISISPDILYRKYSAYKKGNINGLIDRRGGHNKGQTTAQDYMLGIFYQLYLNDNQLPISRCYALLQNWVQEHYPEDCADMPSERTFRRKAKELPLALVMYKRVGDKAFADKCLPYIERYYDDLNANDVWIADNHTLDFFVKDENGKAYRPYLTAFTDAKSGIMTGWNITRNPSSDSTLLALRHGILRCGVPRAIYVDNGSEFLVSDIGGRGHRRRKDWNKDPLPPTILDFLGIKMYNAIVRNAKAKPIERVFKTLAMDFSRAVISYCGSNVVEQKESLKYILKNGKLPTELQIRAAIDSYIDGDYNVGLYGGKEKRYKGMKRFEVWNESIKSVEFRMADEANLDMLLKRVSRAQKIGRNGVFVTFSGEKLWYYGRETILHIGEPVYVRYDPKDMTQVRVYDMNTDKYLWTWRLADELMVSYLEKNKEVIADAERAIAENKKTVKQLAKKHLEELAPDMFIDVFAELMKKSARGESELTLEKPTTFAPVFSEERIEEKPELAGIQQVELVLDLLNAAGKSKKG